MPRLSAPARSRGARVLLLVCAASGLVHLCGCAKTKLAEIQPRDRKVLYLGVDGLDFELLKPLIEQGQLAKLAELRRRGTLVPLLGDRASVDPFSAGLDPAESSTTIATGFTAQHAVEESGGHGVRDLLVPVKGSYDELPATSQHRHVMNFWDVLGAAGVKCAIVGWWTTWPAEPVNGYLVSDRFFLEKFGLTAFGKAGRVDLPAVAEGYRHGAQHLTWPEQLADPLATALAPMVAEPAGLIFPAMRELQSQATDPRTGAATRRDLQQLEQSLRTDSAIKDALVSLLTKDRSIRFAACQLDALDVATHLFWMHIKPEPWVQHRSPSVREKLPRDYQKFASVIPLVAITIDAMVKQICDAMGDDVVVVLVTDHSLDTDTDVGSRDFDLDPLLARLGLLARKADGAIDWSKTTCFDRTTWPRNFVRRLSLNAVGDWPSGSVEIASPQARAIKWREVQAKLLALKIEPPYRYADAARGGAIQEIDTLFLGCTLDEKDLTIAALQALPGEWTVKLPGLADLTINALFPPLASSARHIDPGMLLLSYPGERGDRQGRRGIPMGKGGAMSRHVAPLLLALYGIPPSQREEESAASADYLFWMLELEEAQRLALAPRVASYEELVGFADPAKQLGKRRGELRKFIEELGYDLEAAAKR